ncbi:MULTISPECIES: trypco2 family protein [Micromonospora]|uniref:trypco2 family protein n=1 Tax=Micromonospora TaxID=1873 RepID=UPI0033EB85CE
MSDSAIIPFTEWLDSLRTELSEAQRPTGHDEIRLQIDKVELELEVVSSREVGAKAGVKFWVVEAGADGKVKWGHTQRLKLTVTPMRADGSALEVRDEVRELPR